MIDGVQIKQLRVIPDERGRLVEILRVDDEIFEKFGQAYMTSIYPGIVKGWHYHNVQSDNVACVSGMIKLALYDKRIDSPTFKRVNEFYIGIHNPRLIHIPPGICHGWMCVGSQEAIVINMPTMAYNYNDPDEHRIDPHNNDIPYDWSCKDG